MLKKSPLLALLAFTLSLPSYASGAEKSPNPEESTTSLDKMVVEGESPQRPNSNFTSPSSRISNYEVEGINLSSIEDFVKYEPSLVVRRRFIGDSNGVVGIRGSNMFQTARTMVYADGLPLHYLLQTRWNGSPRWSLVSADETEAVEVIYGPYSAEYSGNAMGGVINIETKMPNKREFHANVATFVQNFEHMGTDETYIGHRESVSVGDRMGDVSLYLSHNHLENESHPQTFRSSTNSGTGATTVEGAIRGQNATGSDVVYYGDSGTGEVTTDLTKLKLGYDFNEWLAKLTLAYENRDSETNPNSYLTDANGSRVWNDSNVAFNGFNFKANGSNFAVSEQNRQTLLVGGGLEGPIGAKDWTLNVNFSHFEVLEDETRSSKKHPLDPAYTNDGSVSEYDDTGWNTFDLKMRTDRFLNRSDMNLVTGYHYDHYKLAVNTYNSSNYRAGEKGEEKTSSGGETSTQAWFAQWGWKFMPRWDLALGGRYELWHSQDGFYNNYANDSLQEHEDRTETGFSPKFSVGFIPDPQWKLRYSAAHAYRFPIVEELFQNVRKTTGTTIANAYLDPEKGIHQNIMAERQIGHGFVRTNLFHEVVENVIFNQTDVATNITTFLPIDEVTTRGIELIVQQERVLGSEIDVRFNTTYTDSEVTENLADPSVVGNDFPRMPHWRANMLLTYRPDQKWNTSLGLRYASNSYGRLDNKDNTEEVYGAQDSYLFADLKANYQINDIFKLSMGINNLTDEIAFVAHPWPQRTFHAQIGAAF